MRIRLTKEAAKYIILALKSQRGYDTLSHENIQFLTEKEQEEAWKDDAEQDKFVKDLIKRLKAVI